MDGSAASIWTSRSPLDLQFGTFDPDGEVRCDVSGRQRQVDAGLGSGQSAGAWSRSSAVRTVATDRTARPIGLPSIEYIARIEVARDRMVVGVRHEADGHRWVRLVGGHRQVDPPGRSRSASRMPSATSWMVMVYGPWPTRSAVGNSSPTTVGRGDPPDPR